MKLSQMRYFSAVCHLGSVTQAAEQLHISQPAITAAIQSLEKELGVLLLCRGRRALVPTPDGEAFWKQCDEILARVDAVTEKFQELGRQRSTISVGIPPMVGFFLFPQIFADFTRMHPEIHMKLTETGSETARELVKDGTLELAIIAVGDTPPAGLDVRTLLRTQMMFCVNREHPLAGRSFVELEDIAREPLILFTGGHYHQHMLQSRFRGLGIAPNVLFYSNQLLTIKSFLRRNLAAAFLLPQVIEDGEAIAAIPVRPALGLNIAVVWRRDVFITREARQFIRFMESRFERREEPTL